MPTSVAFCAVDVNNVGSAQAVPAIRGSSITSETITEGASNTQSTGTCGAAQRFVRVCATVSVWVSVGTNPDATNAATRVLLPANVPETYAVTPGMRVAVATA